jgi:hypothetical protein
MLTRNSSQIHWHRSTSRQRTTAVGPLSITAFSAARCVDPTQPDHWANRRSRGGVPKFDSA